MDVFSLNDDLLGQYTAFARSFTRIRSAEIQNKVDALYAGRRFWPEPLIQLNPHYEGGGSIQALVGPQGLVCMSGLLAFQERYGDEQSCILALAGAALALDVDAA